MSYSNSEDTFLEDSSTKDDLIGKRIGQYEIAGLLGEGGAARVYKAFQPSMERYVALKILLIPGFAGRQFSERFAQEARVIASLEHPNIVPVFDFGESDGYMYIAMRLVEGGSLADMLDGKPFSLYLAHDIITQVGSALEYAHSQGVVHRDIKPSNLLIDEHGNCMISDFGLAKVLTPSAPISMTGTVIGTPAYMSPEQIMSEVVDGRSDLYSLGIVLFEMLTGLPPFKADSTAIVLIRHIQDPLPSARLLNPQLPLAVERVLEKTLAKKPDERYKSASDLVAAVSHAISGDAAEVTVDEASPSQFNRRWLLSLIPLGLIVLLLLGGLGFGGATLFRRLQGERTTATQVFLQLQQAQEAGTAVEEQLYGVRATQAAILGALQSESDALPATSVVVRTEQVAATQTGVAGAASTTILRSTATVTPTPTETPTPRRVFISVSDGTITFRECRGWEGTFTFGQAAPRSLHARSSLTYTVPPGEYILRVSWLNHSDFNVDTIWEVRAGSQIVEFGDQC